MNRIKNWVIGNHDLAFALLLAACVYGYFAFTNDLFATHRTTFAIMERFAWGARTGWAGIDTMHYRWRN